jgi:hypothetical protein
MPNPGEARNNSKLYLILAKPGIIENYAQSNPNNKELCPILAKPGIIQNYAQSWRSQE